MQHWWVWFILAYLSGSVPWALLVGFGRGVDIRKHGSGNIGATNAGRVLGRSWGILAFLLDVLKGALPVAAAGWAMGRLGRTDLTPAETWPWLGVAASAVVGHVFPIWLGFRGGKGVATGLGVVLGFWPLLSLPGVAALLTWVIVLAIFRYVSLASIIAVSLLPVYLIAATLIRGQSLVQRYPLIIVTAGLGLLMVVRHRSNLARLLAGTESKIGRDRKSA